MSDYLFIDGLAIDCCIGVYAWERSIRQRVVLDLRLYGDWRTAAGSDALPDTLDYKAVSDRLIEYVEASEFELIEALAEAVAELLLREFAVRKLRLRLSKPGAVPAAQNVGLQIEREA